MEVLQVTKPQTGEECMEQLTAQWYNALTTGLFLDRDRFQLSQGFQSLNYIHNTDLWNTMDAIPPLSLIHCYDPVQFNNFSQDYGAVINSLAPENEDDFTPCMGGDESKDYASWMKYLDEHGQTLDPEQFPELFRKWASMHAPSRITCAAAYAQLIGDPLTVNLLKYTQAEGKGQFAYNVTADQVDTLMRTQPTTIRFNTEEQSAEIHDTWAKGTRDVFFGIFSSSHDAPTHSEKFYNGGMRIKFHFEKFLTLEVGPFAKANPDDPSLKDCIPWYDSSVLNRAYKHQGSDVWKKSGTATWVDTFGSLGNMQRVASALILVDDFKINISSEASFDELEQQAIADESSGGVWPFYRGSGESGSRDELSFDSEGKMTIKTSSPEGNPLILGILQTPIKDYLG